MVGKNNRNKEVQSNLKQHYKAYKSGKHWVFASIASLSLGMALFFGVNTTTFADATATSTAETTTTAVSTSRSSSSETENTDTDGNATKATSADSTSESTSTADETSSNAETTASGTASSASSSSAVSESVTSDTPATTDNDNGTTDSTINEASSSDPSAVGNDSNVGAASDSQIINDNNTDELASESDSNATTTDTKKTDLGSTSQAKINAAKETAAETYLTTGQPQIISADLATETAEVDATVGTTTKTYDDNPDTPLNFEVTLADGVTAPSGWYATETANQYEVAASSGDLDLSTVDQNVGTYAVTLSSNGVAKLQAVNVAKTITTDNIVAGSLVVEPVVAPSNSIVISGGGKAYDDDTSTDPTSYVVTLGSGLTAADGWTANTDGTYTVSVDSGDLDADITSQDVGSYEITLSDQGLEKLEAANSNYTITSSAVRSGWFNITTNYQLVVGSGSMTVGTSLPATYYVAVNAGSDYSVPSDWTASYSSADQGNIVYSVPASYFDTDDVVTTTVGNYALQLSADTVSTLNSLNSSDQLTANTIENGTITVNSSLTITANSFQPANFYATIGSGTDGAHSYILANGSALQLELRMLNTSTGDSYNNYTVYVIIPAGFVIGTTDSSTGDSSVSTNPADTLATDVEASMAEYDLAYSGLTVTHEDSYNNRQVFKVKFDSVTTINGNDANQADNAISITIVTDPNSTTSAGYIGTAAGSEDDSVLYVTDDYNDTQGAYQIQNQNYYVNVPQVATALGIDDAYALNSTYVNYVYSYTVSQDAQVQDTYHLVGEDGQEIAVDITTDGTPETTYNVLALLPTTIKKDGVTYELKDGSVATYASYPAITSVLSSADAVSTGNTYTVQYLKVIDTTQDSGQIADQTQFWNGTMPATYTVTLPSGLVGASDWTENADGTYSVPLTSNDIDTSDLSTNVGTYTVKLSATGLAKLAAANPNYLFDSNVVKAGTLTINGGQTNYTVTVQDSSGNTLQPDVTESYSWPDGTSVSGVDVAVDGYSADDIKEVVVTANTDSLYNTQGITQLTLTDNGNGTTTYTVLNQDSSKTQTSIIAASVAQLMSGFGISYGAATTISDLEKTQLAQFSKVNVIYQAKAATTTVSYVDTDDNNAVISTDTVGAYVGDTGNYIITIPAGYELADADDQDETILSADGIDTVAYKVTADNSDNLIIKLTHKLVDGTTTTTRTINYVYADGSQASAPVTQTITWKTVSDLVTGTSYATTAQNGYDSVVTPELAGYTADKATVAQQLVGNVETSSLADSIETVTYTANPTVPDNDTDSTPSENDTTTGSGTDEDVVVNSGEAVVVPNDGSNDITTDDGDNQGQTTIKAHTNDTEDINTTTEKTVTTANNGNTNAINNPTAQSTNTAGVLDDETSEDTSSATTEGTNSSNASQNNTAATGKLPQTSESQSGVWAIAGASLLGLLGLVGIGKKKRQDD
ncbi:MBG domain-containing protein [Secundilactobacillus collinoides]|uniref:Cell surface protein n=2 Tax=Secundilactobacillus collinoides TaxID=33960 RepID=A0A0R2BIF1_SECCO|nr:MBG domain-containing protein [Secundilactobacillus collinoides]KRM75315.1 cell surface protein [Secundilactobacillus collinoides DSM 20515 = JCM 1123]KZL42887.1 hypothetical protein TY91_02285 [Secundilactobacillus collinoides]